MTLPIWFTDNFYTQTQKSVIETSINIESPYKVSWVMCGENTPVDIEEDVTVTVDDGCLFMIVDPPADYT